LIFNWLEELHSRFSPNVGFSTFVPLFLTMHQMKFATKLIHAGVHPDPVTGAVMTPIYQTSTYAQTSPGVHKGYEYSRTHNPTRTVLQDNLAALEDGKYGICFATGLAATDAVMKILKPGDEVIASSDLYGGTYRLFTKIYEGFGIRFKFIRIQSGADVEPHITDQTRLIWVESPTNPLLHIVDIASVAKVARAKNILFAVDNTFATPFLQNPLLLGAHIVMHSLTKYMAGHSDVVMGALIVNDDDLHQKLAFVQNASGATPGPQDCFLVLRGLKTLHVRMERHCRNARELAQWLYHHPKVGHVYYPGLEHHVGHAVAAVQMADFGGMLSFTLKNDDLAEAIRVMENLKVFTLAESLGGVESLCTHPASMTHASIPKEEREKNGLKDTLIRLSVGLEDIDDLKEDLAQAIG
jgi:cystathionine beta-lyase/cystathionine gamma-synthase